MKAKKFTMVISVILVISLLFSLTANAFGPSRQNSGETIKNVFYDDEGKENVVLINMLSRGSVSVEHYIDGEYFGTATARTTDGYIVYADFTEASTRTISEYTLDFTPEANNESTVSDYSTIMSSAKDLPFMSRAYSFAGTITYKPYYDNWGNVYNEKLNVYLQANSEKTEYRTLNTAAGYAAALAIAALVVVLTIFCPPLTAIASHLLSALALAAGTTIVGGVIQGAISKTYYTKILPYDVRATDPKSNRSNDYWGERCYSAVPGSGSSTIWSSSYYYNGYLPWNSYEVAYWFFCDFWAYPYPGI